MAKNYYSDYPARKEMLRKHCALGELAIPLEDTFGDKGSFKSADEAMELYDGVLEEIGKLCAQVIHPSAEEIDRIGAKMKDGEVVIPEKLDENIKKCAELGVFSACIKKANGGLNLPQVVQTLGMEMFGQACPNTGLNVANYSMAGFLEKHGTEEQKAKYLAKMMTCEVRSSMALTEPNAGSDLGKLRTTAKKNGDHWLINGSKIFISGAHSGGYEDISFVLARTDPNSTGLNGLSVFIAPRMIDGKANFKVPKIEDKVCLHASPTCELLFENTQATLFGEEGNGFRVMTDLMNGARLMMAALATGIAVGAMEEAKAYAKTRMTMGKPIIQHPMVSDMLYEMEIETRAMRAMISEAACAYDWMAIAEKKGDQKEFKRWKKRYRRLTPLCKYYCCEKAITIAKNAVQIFGGYGVCKDYPVERLWRETLIYPIYEGTSQIQSLMVLKDTLKDVASQASGFLGSLAGAWAESLVTRDPVKAKLLQGRNELNQGIKTVLMSIIREKFKSDIESLKAEKIQDFLKQFSLELLSAKTDLTYPFLWAERFTRITCDYYALKCMADHANSSDEEWKKWTLEFAALALPRMQLENTYMVNRLPSTLEYLEKQKES